MACTWLIVEQVTNGSIGDPPQIVVSRLNEVVMELNQCGVHHTLHLHWVLRPLPERHRETDDEGKIVIISVSNVIFCCYYCCFSGIVSDHGYRTSDRIPILCGEDFSPHCLFVPCLGLWTIFVKCVVHIQQTTKKGIIFIKKIKQTLMNLNLWMDEEYLQRQEEETVRDHKRDIIPNCIISYSFFFWLGDAF